MGSPKHEEVKRVALGHAKRTAEVLLRVGSKGWDEWVFGVCTDNHGKHRRDSSGDSRLV